jgi:hypothetical protein
VYLGYTFPTDILVLRIALQAPFNAHYDDTFHRRPLVDAARSLSEALALAAASRLDIDPRELKAGFRFLTIQNERVVDLFLYDTLAGGAGYASMAGRDISEIARETKEILSGCACSSSCDKCLRSYENRFFHRSLDRFLALDLLDYAQSGIARSIGSQDEQRRRATALVEFLQLEGWQVSRGTDAAYVVSYGAASHKIAVYPSLMDIDEAQQCCPGALLFSEYELANGLPDAAARVLR